MGSLNTQLRIAFRLSSFFLGSAVLVVTTTDVDTTGASYYGEQTLHYISTSGESSMVQLGNLLNQFIFILQSESC